MAEEENSVSKLREEEKEMMGEKKPVLILWEEEEEVAEEESRPNPVAIPNARDQTTGRGEICVNPIGGGRGSGGRGDTRPLKANQSRRGGRAGLRRSRGTGRDPGRDGTGFFQKSL